MGVAVEVPLIERLMGPAPVKMGPYCAHAGVAQNVKAIAVAKHFSQ